VIVASHYRHRQIFFEGNSLFARSSGNTVNGHYIPNQVYTNITDSGAFAFHSYALGGQTMTTINDNKQTQIVQWLKDRDIVILWEIVNDVRTNNSTGQQVFDLLKSYYTSVKASGAKLLLVTGIASDFAGDAADVWTRVSDCNTLIRATPSDVCDAYADAGNDSRFDSVADTANTDNYNADKIHLTQAGYDAIEGIISPVLTTLLKT